MLLTITTTRAPATDLGYLLHKHPGRVQSFDVASGTAHVFYPEAAGERCTAALLLERAVFGLAAPGTVVVTTPNREHNAEYGMPGGALRHRDHRFEWDRAEFGEWASRVSAMYGYTVRLLPVGPESAAAGPATQMAVFTAARTGAAA